MNINDIAVFRDIELTNHEKHGYFNFFKRAWHTIEHNKLVTNWHIQFLCDRLQYEVERISRNESKTKDLIINIPPRTSKSSIVTIFLNAWAWTKYPQIKFITTSYSSTLSEKHSIKTKEIIESKWYKDRYHDKFELSKKKNTNIEFHNNKKGLRFATSTKGTVTGEGADIIIADDLLNPLQAKSRAEREKAIDFYRNTLSNRLNNPRTGIIVIINQRTHESDVTGTELNDNPELYDVINLPSETEYNNIKPSYLIKYYTNGLLDPVRLGRNELDKLRKRMTDYDGQYGQSPSSPGGNILKREWYFTYDLDELLSTAGDKIVWNFQLDGAYTKKKENDPSGIIAYAYFGNKYFIRKVETVRKSFTELLDYIKEFLRENGYSKQSILMIEPKANGKDLVDVLREWTNINVIESYNPNFDKIMMCNKIAPTVKSGRVGVPINSNWTNEYFTEIENFPNSKHDERIDLTIMMIENEGGGVVAWG